MVTLGFAGAGLWNVAVIGDGAADREFRTLSRVATAADVIDVPMPPGAAS